jgi:probable HAF family extracellular repeat protein
MNGKLSGVSLSATLISLASASQAHASTPAYTYIDLGTLGGNKSVPNAVNNAGQVAGWSETAGGQIHATVWNATMATDLGTLGGTGNSGAVGLNNTGQVVVDSRTWGDMPAPIPEPESYALFLAGLALVGFIARRKKVSGKGFTPG